MDWQEQWSSLEKQYSTVGFSLEDVLSLFECSPRVETHTTRTAWKPRNTSDVTSQTADVTPSTKTADLKKRNEQRERATYRERRRLGQLNDAFCRLREILPSAHRKTKKVDVLRMASQYIKEMSVVLKEYSETKEITFTREDENH